MKKALLFGASGFVGSYILRKILADERYGRVTAVVRRPLGIEHPRLQTLTGDYASLRDVRDALEGDEVYIALGTTKGKTPDRDEYYTVDHDYPVLAGAVAKERGAASVFFVSAVGANAQSGFFYNRTKGETERDIIALGYEHTHIFRPSIIMGERSEHRPMEKALITACRLFNPLLCRRPGEIQGHTGGKPRQGHAGRGKPPGRQAGVLRMVRYDGAFTAGPAARIMSRFPSQPCGRAGRV